MDKNLVNFRLEGGEEQDCAGPGRRTLVIASLTLFQFCAQPNFLAGLQELGTAKGTSAKDFQVEFLSFNFSYVDGLLAFAGSSLEASVNKQPLSDDLDSTFGLHDFEVSLELRSFEASYWFHKFRGVFTKNLEKGWAVFELVSSDPASPGNERTHFLDRPVSFEWQGLILGSRIADLAVIDIEILDEFKRVFHSSSQVVRLKEAFLFRNQIALDQMDGGTVRSVLGGS